MKRIVSFILSICLLMQFSSCSESSDAKLNTIGLNLISVMSEMVQSEEYGKMVGASGMEELLEAVDTDDYNSPTAVYRITPPDEESLLDLINQYDHTLWNKLSDNLKEQIKNKISFSSITSIINSKNSVQKTAFSAVYAASGRNEEIRLEQETVLLYIFEKGTPIAITFSKDGRVNGQFIFLEAIDNLSDAKATFEKYECTVNKADID